MSNEKNKIAAVALDLIGSFLGDVLVKCENIVCTKSDTPPSSYEAPRPTMDTRKEIEVEIHPPKKK